MKNVKTDRLMSIDALRGFDMLFIMGGAALLIALAEWYSCPRVSVSFSYNLSPYLLMVSSSMNFSNWFW